MVAICPGLSRAARDGPGTQHAWSGAHAAFTAGGILEGSEASRRHFAKKIYEESLGSYFKRTGIGVASNCRDLIK